MLDMSGRLRTLAVEEARHRHSLTVLPLSAVQAFGAADVRTPDAAAIAAVAHLASESVGPGRSGEMVANEGGEPLLLLQGDALATGDGHRDAFEFLAPRLLLPGEPTSLPVAAGPVSGRPPGGGWKDERIARKLLAGVGAVPPGEATGYLALVAGRFARLELFPSAGFCRRRWAWALGSVAGLAGRLNLPPSASPPQAGAILVRLADAVAPGAWLPDGDDRYVLRLEALGEARLRGHLVVRDGRPVYLDLAARLRPAQVGVLAAPRPGELAAAVALPLPRSATRTRSIA